MVDPPGRISRRYSEEKMNKVFYTLQSSVSEKLIEGKKINCCFKNDPICGECRTTLKIEGIGMDGGSSQVECEINSLKS